MGIEGIIVLVVAVPLLVGVLVMLRRGSLREKYAILWLTIGLGMVVVGAVPPVWLALTRLLGIAIPANLIFALGIGLLLALSVHYARELTVLEHETRRLAEEVAILGAQMRMLSDGRPADGAAAGAPDRTLGDGASTLLSDTHDSDIEHD